MVSANKRAYTGQDLVGYLCNIVDIEWSRLWKALFCTEQPLQSLPLFVIEVYPTQRQPGNGRVRIRTNSNKFVAYTYSTNPANGVLNGILSPSFPEFWNKFITTPFGFSRLDMTEERAACILLTFEIARKTGNDQSQLARQQVSEAIHKVMFFHYTDQEAYKYLVRVAQAICAQY